MARQESRARQSGKPGQGAGSEGTPAEKIPWAQPGFRVSLEVLLDSPREARFLESLLSVDLKGVPGKRALTSLSCGKKALQAEIIAGDRVALRAAYNQLLLSLGLAHSLLKKFG